jgi:hypothetical protein
MVAFGTSVPWLLDGTVRIDSGKRMFSLLVTYLLTVAPGAPGPNPEVIGLAQGANIVSVASEHDQVNAAWRLLDGDRTTVWCSKQSQKAPQEIVISLPRKFLISAIAGNSLPTP